MVDIVTRYLDLLDSQRETAFSALDGLTENQIWQRPAPHQWCIGEILDHNYLLIKSTLPLVRMTWSLGHRLAEKRRDRPFEVDMEDPYRKKSFPMWVGFLWTPRYTPRRPISLEFLKQENRVLHLDVREFYAIKDPAHLGNIYIYDPLLGLFNLIVTLRIGIYHDQLHYDDVIKMAQTFKST